MRVPIVPLREPPVDPQVDAARQIAAEIDPLIRRAETRGYEMLAYLLDLAKAEAERRAGDGLKAAAEPPR